MRLFTDPGYYHFWILLATVAIVLIIFITKNVPNIDNLIRFSQVMDTRGGNITVLLFLTLFFFAVSIGFAYFVMDGIIDKTITPENTMAILIVQWLTGGAFGAAMGALIKSLHSDVDTTKK